MYRGRHEVRSSSSKHRNSSRERRSRTPPPLSYSDGLTAGQRRIMEMEEKIRQLDKSLEATTQRIQSYQEREERLGREPEPRSVPMSKPRRRSRSRERSPHRSSSSQRRDVRSPPRKIPARPDDNFDQFRRINEFRMQYEASTSSQKSYEPIPVYPTQPEPQRYSFPVFWNQEQNEIRVDPVPVYPGCFGDEEEDEEKERSMRALEEQRRAYEEEKQMEILAKEAARIKKQHFMDIEKREKEEKHKKEEAERKRKLEEDESRRKEREKKDKVEPKKSESIKKSSSSSSSSSSTSLLTQRILAFFKELNVSLGVLVYESSVKKTQKGYDDWTTVCHITNIPKELISATSIGKSSKESSRNHSVERFFDKLVNFGILTKKVREDFAKYKTLPVFLAGIMNDFFNDIAIYGTQISVTGDRDMSKKFAAFAKEKSEEFWNRQESVVVAFLKCQAAALSSSSSSSSSRKTEESSRTSSRDSDERRAKERRDRERDRERREKEKEKDRERDKIRRRAEDNAKEYVAPQVPIIYPTVVAPTPTQPAYMNPYQPGMAPIMNYLQTCVGGQQPQFNPMGPPPSIGQFAAPMVAPQQFQPTPFAPRPDFPVQCYPNGASVKPQPLMGPAKTNGSKKEEVIDIFDEVFK